MPSSTRIPVVPVNRDFSFGVTKLLRDPAIVKHLDLEGQIPEIYVTSSWIADDEVIHLEGVAESVHEGILVKANISTNWSGECVRCLSPASGDMKVSVIELFEERADPEGDSYPFDGDVVDLAEMIKDNLVLELPLVPLCKNDCRGLCQYCGQNLNIGTCDCKEKAIDPVWQALSELEFPENT
ncbi:MAG: DUF177 domain-containing protein [Acidimicrobiaceae bacterium]|nr:DUF177 domain-containing protein [Acidimicrobiaceae bacterium]